MYIYKVLQGLRDYIFKKSTSGALKSASAAGVNFQHSLTLLVLTIYVSLSLTWEKKYWTYNSQHSPKLSIRLQLPSIQFVNLCQQIQLISKQGIALQSGRLLNSFSSIIWNPPKTKAPSIPNEADHKLMEEKFDKATVNQIFPFFIHTIQQSLLPFFQYKFFLYYFSFKQFLKI